MIIISRFAYYRAESRDVLEVFRYIFAPNFAFFQFDEGRNDYDRKGSSR